MDLGIVNYASLGPESGNFRGHSDTVIDQINQGAGTDLRFDTFMVGHPRCNRYAMAFEINC